MTKATVNGPTNHALNAADILKKRAVRIERVPTPEWEEGSYVLVRGMRGRERDAWEESLVDQTGKDPKNRKMTLKNQRARVVSMCVVNEAGERLFSDDQIHDLGELEAAPLDRIYDVATALSGIGSEDLEEILGKFKDQPLSDSPSG